MSESKRCKIGLYLTWCGADAVQSFDTFEQYQKARAFLDPVISADAPRHSTSGDTLDNLYVVTPDRRDEFEKFMRSL